MGKQRSWVLVFVSALIVTATLAQTAKQKRINQAIELLAEGQPIYYAGSHSGTNGTYEQGVKDAQTYADYISYDMEHAPFDVKGLQEYMRGLVAGGPDRSGHRTPAVIVNVPVNGMDAEAVHANAWMFNQVLATGVHGIMLTHADDPGAIRAFVEAVRFPIHHEGVGPMGCLRGGAAFMELPTRRKSGESRRKSTRRKQTSGRSIQMANCCSGSRKKTNTRWPMLKRT